MTNTPASDLRIASQPAPAEAHGLLHEFEQLLQSAERTERYLASTPLPVASDVYSALSHACDQGQRVVADALAKPQPKSTQADEPASDWDGKEPWTVDFDKLVCLLNEARCLSSRTVGNVELARRIYKLMGLSQAPAPAPDVDYVRRLAEDWADDCIKAGYVTTGALSHKTMTDAIRALAAQAPAVGAPATGKQNLRVAPLTREKIEDIMTQHYPLESLLRESVDAFEACVRDIESAHGIDVSDVPVQHKEGA